MKILIAGTARCGSTWAANVLGRADQSRSVYEPDGPRSDILGAMVATRLGEYPVLQPGQRSGWYRLVWDLAFSGGWPWDNVETARAAGRRMVRIPPLMRDYLVAGLAEGTRRVRRGPRNVLVKSVNSAFSLEWIAQRYQPRVLVLRRNPLNVVSSWVVLNMWSDRPIGQHPAVRERYLAPIGVTAPDNGASAVRIAAFNVGLLTRALRQAAAEHPEWIVASHDQLCIDPETGFRDLTARLGLRWTPAMTDYLRKSDDPSFTVHGGTPKFHPNAVSSTTTDSRRDQQASQFKRRLTPAQADEAREVLASFDLAEWGVPAA